MAVGDEFGLTEDLYQQIIGRSVAAIEVLSKRIVAKDQHIARIETENANLASRIGALQDKVNEATALVEKVAKKGKAAPKDGDVYYGEQPPK